jgi:hypothetical protein
VRELACARLQLRDAGSGDVVGSDTAKNGCPLPYCPCSLTSMSAISRPSPSQALRVGASMCVGMVWEL